MASSTVAHLFLWPLRWSGALAAMLDANLPNDHWAPIDRMPKMLWWWVGRDALALELFGLEDGEDWNPIRHTNKQEFEKAGREGSGNVSASSARSRHGAYVASSQVRPQADPQAVTRCASCSSGRSLTSPPMPCGCRKILSICAWCIGSLKEPCASSDDVQQRTPSEYLGIGFRRGPATTAPVARPLDRQT